MNTDQPITCLTTQANTNTNLLQGLNLLFLPFIQSMALALQGLPLFFHPQHLVLQPASLVVQVPDGCLLGHLCGLQAAYLTCKMSKTTGRQDSDENNAVQYCGLYVFSPAVFM